MENQQTEPFVNQTGETYLIRMKLRLFRLMGGKCVKCGFTDHRALQIDHVDGGGSKEMKEEFRCLGRNIYLKAVEKSYLEDEGKYQLLCANCNWIKRIENREFGGGRSQKLSKLKYRGRHIFSHEKPTFTKEID